MFNGHFEDLPHGVLLFKYKIKVDNFNLSKNLLNGNLNPDLLNNANLDQLFEDLNYLTDATEKANLKFYLSPRGTHFADQEEEQEHNSWVDHYTDLVKLHEKIKINYGIDLGLKISSINIAKNHDQQIVSGPKRRIPLF